MKSDINFNMKLPELLSLVLQVSGKQSMALGISNEFIYEKYQLVWIVTDYAIEIERLPKYAETITVETVPTSYNKLFVTVIFTFTMPQGQKSSLFIRPLF